MALAKTAFEEQKSFDNARVVYVTTLILNKDFKTASDVLVEKYGTSLVYNDQIIGAYNAVGQINISLEIIKSYIKNNPNDAQARVTLASTYVTAGDKASAIQVLLSLEKDFPNYKAQLDAYIAGLRK